MGDFETTCADKYNKGFDDGYAEALRATNHPETAEWITKDGVIWACSKCKTASGQYNYCHHCGAKMKNSIEGSGRIDLS